MCVVCVSRRYIKDHSTVLDLASSPRSPFKKSNNGGEPGIFSYMTLICGLGSIKKTGCISLPFARDTASVLSLWHQRALKISHEKCRIAAFPQCLRTATVLTFAQLHVSSFYALPTLNITQVRKIPAPSPCLGGPRDEANGALMSSPSHTAGRGRKGSWV